MKGEATNSIVSRLSVLQNVPAFEVEPWP